MLIFNAVAEPSGKESLDAISGSDVNRLDANLTYTELVDEEFRGIGNFLLHDIVTPIKIDKYKYFMELFGFEEEKKNYLLKGFKEGFDIGYRGPVSRQDTARNIPITIGSESDMWDKLMKEVSLGRHAGPFNRIPYSNYIQSPIGLVPKAGNQTRLIFHLSYNFGEDESQMSLNYHTPSEMCTVKYKDIDYAV